MPEASNKCPFCKEDINIGATKCKFCCSHVDTPSRAEDRGSDVIYIVDRGVVQFAKFAAGCFAIFLFMGVFAFGIDVKSLVNDMHDAQKEMREAEENVLETKDKMREASDKVLALKKDMAQAIEGFENNKKEVEMLKTDFVSFLSSRRQQVEIYYTQQIKMTSSQSLKLDTLRADPSSLARPSQKVFGNGLHLWKNNIQLQIAFLGGNDELRSAVEQTARQWIEGTSLQMDFSSNVSTSQIRITFDDDGNWSFLGADALTIPSDRPTLCLHTAAQALLKNDTKLFKRIVLLEFGHALGLISEVQNPDAHLHLDLQKIARNFGMTQEEVKSQFSPIEIANYRKFDPTSVMMFDLPSSLNEEGVEYKEGYDLSESDRELIQKLYPK